MPNFGLVRIFICSGCFVSSTEVTKFSPEPKQQKGHVFIYSFHDVCHFECLWSNVMSMSTWVQLLWTYHPTFRVPGTFQLPPLCLWDCSRWSGQGVPFHVPFLVPVTLGICQVVFLPEESSEHVELHLCWCEGYIDPAVKHASHSQRQQEHQAHVPQLRQIEGWSMQD